MTEARHVVWLGERTCDEPALVGGKAAALSRLAGRYPISPGLALTTEAFDLACAARSSASDRVTLPPPLVEEVAGAYRRLSESCGTAAVAVAVRSSAVGEDGLLASFAGQYHTLLNVMGVKDLVSAIEACWSSFQSARATDYRRGQGLAPSRPRAAVLVQELVVADASAVAFTGDPVNGTRNEVVINATWGLGESLVGGAVTPDTYAVSKADLAIGRESIADKRRMTVPVSGGTREVAVPGFLRMRPALRKEDLIGTARLGLALEQDVGHPVDIECAYRGDRLHLLQCRPITTLCPGWQGEVE
jgi:pyruvate, water dikinase